MLGPFAIVQIGDTSLDFMESDGEIAAQHYAFLVTELEFDEIFGRIRAARPDLLGRSIAASMRGAINEWDGGRGVYWDDPERASAGDHHAALRHRRQPGA